MRMELGPSILAFFIVLFLVQDAKNSARSPVFGSILTPRNRIGPWRTFQMKKTIDRRRKSIRKVIQPS
jgi:hypothetical protein